MVMGTLLRNSQIPYSVESSRGAHTPRRDLTDSSRRDEQKTLLVTERIDLGGGIVLLPGMRLRPEEAVCFLGQRWALDVGASGAQPHGAGGSG